MERTEVFGENEFAVVLSDDGDVRSEKGSGAEKIEHAGIFFGGGVGRIDEDEIDWRIAAFVASGEFFETAEGVQGENIVDPVRG